MIEERSSSMIGHMNLEVQVDVDFSRARRRALLRRIGARLRRGTAPDGLLCFDDVRKIPGAIGRIDRGTRTVLVSQIGGSVGRCSEFDGDFMPAKASVEERWKRMDRAFHRGEELPPVSLYKIGSFYFVLDGHHRVSVAHYHGVEWLLLHGFPQTHLMWRSVAPSLSRGCTVVCADLRGYGQSGCPPSAPNHAPYS